MIKKTKNYEMFKFREDNRKIQPIHLERLIASIRSCNMLEFRPILIDENNYVIDGQHRLMAAKSLGFEIFYDMKPNLEGADMIALNISRSWVLIDYFQYYTKNGNPEYLKLKEFMDTNKLSLKVALNLVISKRSSDFGEFKDGSFVFKTFINQEIVDICWVIIEQIIKLNGHAPWTKSSRFWKALTKLVNSPDFELKKWMNNFEKHCVKLVGKANEKDYLNTMLEIYNWRNQNKIEA